MSYLPTLLALIAAFCCLAEFASPLERMRKLVGAVGIDPKQKAVRFRSAFAF
jgi:hypothetical protein